ncbi:MAG: hypothetical protein R3C56_07150 [Pirellulaceae bacterium]
MRIVSGAGGAAVVEVAQDALTDSQQTDGVWRLQTAELTVQGVVFEIKLAADAISQPSKGLFALAGSSKWTSRTARLPSAVTLLPTGFGC